MVWMYLIIYFVLCVIDAIFDIGVKHFFPDTKFSLSNDKAYIVGVALICAVNYGFEKYLGKR